MTKRHKKGVFFLGAACFAVALFCYPLFARAGAEDERLLLRIGLTSEEKNFTGRKMVINFSRLTPQVTMLTVVHQLGGKERREYHASRGIVVIDGNSFCQYFPEKKLVVKRKLPGKGGWESLRRDSLKQAMISYELKNSPGGRIAGRQSRLYEFLPRQVGSRPMRKVWVDVETGLVLRMEIYSPDNKLFWLSVFEDLDYHRPVDPASFTLQVPAGVKVVESPEERCLSLAEAERIAELPLSLPKYLPSGFVMKCVRARRSRDYGEIQVLYSDGLSLLSLFESSRFRSPLSSRSSAEYAARVGEYPARWYDRGLVTALSWRPPWAHLTILGEISREELLEVAESIRPSWELSRP